MKLAIVIPTYNEKKNLSSLIENLIKEIKRISEKFLIVIVDDASPDGTGQIAEELNQKYGCISVLHRPTKMGLGSAYKEGFGYALTRFDPDFVVQMDADHSHDPAEIQKMLDIMNGYDYVIASRHVIGSSTIGWSTYRKVVHSTAGKLAAMCGSIKISDPTSGFRIFKKSLLHSIDFTKIRSQGFAFQVELLCFLQAMGFKGIESPTRFVNRIEGKSKMGLKEAIQFTKMCIFLLNRRKLSNNRYNLTRKNIID